MKKRIAALLLPIFLSGCCYIEQVPAAGQNDQTISTTAVATVATLLPQTEPTHPMATEETAPIETQPMPFADEINQGYTCGYKNSDCTLALADDILSTRVTLTEKDNLEITSDQPIGALYLSWYTAPQTFTIFWEEGELTRDEGFLHDYISLPQEVTQLTIQGGGDLSELRLFTAGSPPQDVQNWQSPVEQADILAFVTHSDDDALFFGAALCYYAIQRELDVQVCFMVEHNEVQRQHERLNGMWEMGLRNYPMIGPGSDVYSTNLGSTLQYHERNQEDILQWQVEMLRCFRPLVVLGHDLKGEYGHGQHMVNAYYLTQAVELAGMEEAYPQLTYRYGTWDTPKLYLHMYEENTIYLDVDTPMSIDLAERSPYEVAQAGFLQHVSQKSTGFYISRGNGMRRCDCRCWGLYRSLVGADTQADLMAGIDPAQWRE